MRLSLWTLAVAVVLACGSLRASSLAAPSIDGLWSAYSDGLGSTLTMTLSAKGKVVSGTGTYRVGALRSGTVAIAGTYNQPEAALTLTYDHGDTVTFAGEVTDEHMKGKLTYKDGTAIDLEFVRP